MAVFLSPSPTARGFSTPTRATFAPPDRRSPRRQPVQEIRWLAASSTTATRDRQHPRTCSCALATANGYVYLGHCRADVAGHDNVPNKIARHISNGVSSCAAMVTPSRRARTICPARRRACCGGKAAVGRRRTRTAPSPVRTSSPTSSNGLIFYKCDHGVELSKLPPGVVAVAASVPAAASVLCRFRGRVVLRRARIRRGAAAIGHRGRTPCPTAVPDDRSTLLGRVDLGQLAGIAQAPPSRTRRGVGRMPRRRATIARPVSTSARAHDDDRQEQEIDWRRHPCAAACRGPSLRVDGSPSD